MKSPDYPRKKSLNQVIGSDSSQEDLHVNHEEREEFSSILRKSKTIMDIEKFEQQEDKSSVKTSQLSSKIVQPKVFALSDSSSFESESLSTSSDEVDLKKYERPGRKNAAAFPKKVQITRLDSKSSGSIDANMKEGLSNCDLSDVPNADSKRDRIRTGMFNFLQKDMIR